MNEKALADLAPWIIYGIVVLGFAIVGIIHAIKSND
jgi:hypothetical protein